MFDPQKDASRLFSPFLYLCSGHNRVFALRWNLMYLTLVLHGVGTLMPWNIFINAKTVSYVSIMPEDGQGGRVSKGNYD